MSFLKMKVRNLFLSIILILSLPTMLLADPLQGAIERGKREYAKPESEAAKAYEADQDIRGLAESWMVGKEVNEFQDGIDDLGVGGAVAGHTWDFDEFMASKIGEVALPFTSPPMLFFNPLELLGGGISFSAKTNHPCHDYELGLKAGIKAGFLFIKLDAELCLEGSSGPRCGCSLFGGCRCRWTFTMYPWSRYRYPVDKVEAPEQAWRTRYMGKENVKQLKNIVLNEPIEFSTLRLNKILSYARSDIDYVQKTLELKRGTPVPPVEAPSLQDLVKEEDIEKAREGVDGKKLEIFNSKEGLGGARSVEFHVVPELYSRESYEGVDALRGLPLPFARVSISVPPVPPSISVSFGIKWVGSVCHANKEPAKVEQYDPLRHFLGSEFPFAPSMDPRHGTTIGLYPITRDPYAVYTNAQLTAYKDPFMILRRNPFICSMYNMGSGITPPGMIPARIMEKFAGSYNVADAEKALCQGGNLGSLLPFVNWGRVAHDTTAAQLAFLRGVKLASIYKPQYFYKFDRSTDAVQWISSDNMGGNTCHTDFAKPFSKFGFDAPSLEFANSQVPQDIPNVGVKWRKVKCCAAGRPFGFSPIME